MNTIDVVEVLPVEFNYKKDYIRIYRKIKISPNLTQEKFNQIISKENLKEYPSIIGNPNCKIYYQYPNKPMIILDLQNNKILTNLDVWNTYQHHLIMHQASIILRILRKHHLANFKRALVTISTDRLGETKKERELTHKLIEESIQRKYERYGRNIKEKKLT